MAQNNISNNGYDESAFVPVDLSGLNFDLDTSASYISQLAQANTDNQHNANQQQQQLISETNEPTSTDSNAEQQESSNASKNATRRITLNAHQQLVTLQFFYDQYPQDAYSDEDIFRLSSSCSLDFDLTKRRLSNLNGKQKDLRNALFNTELGLDKDVILELLAQHCDNEHIRAMAPGATGGNKRSAAGGRASQRKKRSRLALGIESLTFESAVASANSDNSNGRKRAGKDERVLVELHHRELLGAGFTLTHLHVLGQGQLVKDWLAQKRVEVQGWLWSQLGAMNAPKLADPFLPYYAPTTPAELLESEIGPAYLQYTASLKTKRGGNSSTSSSSAHAANVANAAVVASSTATPAPVAVSSNGGGWLIAKGNHHHHAPEPKYMEMAPMGSSVSMRPVTNSTGDMSGMLVPLRPSATYGGVPGYMDQAALSSMLQSLSEISGNKAGNLYPSNMSLSTSGPTQRSVSLDEGLVGSLMAGSDSSLDGELSMNSLGIQAKRSFSMKDRFKANQSSNAQSASATSKTPNAIPSDATATTTTTAIDPKALETYPLDMPACLPYSQDSIDGIINSLMAGNAPQPAELGEGMLFDPSLLKNAGNPDMNSFNYSNPFMQ